MNNKIAVLFSVLMFADIAYAQDNQELSALDIADIITEQVNTEGLLSAVNNSELSDTEIRMLNMAIDLGLPESDEAREALDRRIDGEMPELYPDFTITSSTNVMRKSVEMSAGVMDMLRMQKSAAAMPLPDGVRIPIETQQHALIFSFPLAFPIISKSPPAKTQQAVNNIHYSVWVENQTEIVVDEMIVFFKQRGDNVMQMRQVIPVLPGGIALFDIGMCSAMESYSLGIFIDNELVARIPAEGLSMTPELAELYHPWDKDPCKDTWGFGR